MSRTATMESLPRAFEMIKEMGVQGYQWGEDYRRAGRAAVVEVLEDRMTEAVDRHLERIAAAGGIATRRRGPDRRGPRRARPVLASRAGANRRDR